MGLNSWAILLVVTEVVGESCRHVDLPHQSLAAKCCVPAKKRFKFKYRFKIEFKYRLKRAKFKSKAKIKMWIFHIRALLPSDVSLQIVGLFKFKRKLKSK